MAHLGVERPLAPPELRTVPPLGTLLQHARHAHGLSQQALAQRCTLLLGQHVTGKHVSSLEHDHCLPSLPLLQVLTMVLDLDPAAVLTARIETTDPAAHALPLEPHTRVPRDQVPQDLLTRVQQATRHLAAVRQAHHEALVAARQGGASWGQLAAVAGLSPSRIRQLLGRILAP
jgi:transcriptional regulator with XRE-family HTH domain